MYLPDGVEPVVVAAPVVDNEEVQALEKQLRDKDKVMSPRGKQL